MENISGNIANSRTTGFKRVDTAFADLVPDLPPTRELSGSVGAFSRNTVTVGGDIQTSQIGTNIALSGNGFVIVRERTGDSAGQPVFTGTNKYTRRGDFALDRNGYLVNGTGNYLMGYSVDPTTNATNGTLQVLKISNNNVPAKATTTVSYSANLPKTPLTAVKQSGGSELLTPALDIASVPYSSEANFLDQTVAGNAVTVYDPAGSPVNVQVRWGKTSNAAPETWSMFYQADTQTNPPAATPRWTRVSNAIQFSAAGVMTAPASGILTQSFTVDGVTTNSIDLTFGASGLSQFADANGVVVVNRIAQDGYPTGQLSNVSVGDGGRILGTYTNGQTLALGAIPTADFAAADLLKRADGGIFVETLESGQPIISSGGSNIVGASTENSNVDIADEFSKMIVTQQAYSANTRVVTTAQTMLQDVINIIR